MYVPALAAANSVVAVAVVVGQLYNETMSNFPGYACNFSNSNYIRVCSSIFGQMFACQKKWLSFAYLTAEYNNLR